MATPKRGALLEKMPTFKKEVVLQRFELTRDTWWVRIYTGNRNYRFYNLETSDSMEAQQKAFERWEKFQKEQDSGSTLKTTLRRLFLLFIDSEEKEVDRGKLAEATFASKRSGILNGILPYIAAKGLRDPTKVNSNRDFRGYPDFRFDEGKNPSTINNEIITLREAFRWMRREEFVEYDVPYVETFTIDQRKREESNPPIPVDDFVLIKEWLDEYVGQDIKNRWGNRHKPHFSKRERFARELFRQYCLTSVAAALRPHEWRSLTWGMVEFKSDGSTEISIPHWCKTGRRLVVCYTPELKGLKKLQEDIAVEVTKDTHLGTNPNTNKPFSAPFYTDRWKPMLEELKMDFTEYSMRAAGICSRLEAGVPVFTVAKWAGNSVKVIEMHYTASIMKSSKMKAAVLKDTRQKWKRAGILFGDSSDYIIRDLD